MNLKENWLKPEHIADLKKSGLKPDIVKKAGVHSVTASDINKILGTNHKVDSLLAFPYPKCNGFTRWKVFPPQKSKDGRSVKYFQPKGSGLHLYVPPGFDPNPKVIRITEGEKKALKGTQESLNVLGLGGIWNFAVKDETGLPQLIEDFNIVNWKDKEVELIADSDFLENDSIRLAVFRLGTMLEELGAKVFAYDIPVSLDAPNEKVGLDDFLVKRGVKDLHECMSESRVSLTHSIFKKARDAEQKRKIKLSDTRSPSQIIDSIREDTDLKPFQKMRFIADAVSEDLKNRGYFITTKGKILYFFDKSKKKLFELTSFPFSRFIESNYALNPTEKEFKFALEYLLTEAHERGEKAEVHIFSYYDDNNGTLYIYNYAGQYYTLDGENVTLHDNGSRGVFFVDNPLYEPFVYNEEHREEGQLDKLLIEGVSFSSSILSTENAEFLLSLYIYSLFFESLHPTKPILLFVGPKGSGKTTRMRLVGIFLFGKGFNVNSLMKDKEDAFISGVSNNSFVAFDNVDGRIKWLNNRLASIATGEAIRLRTLYTTNQEAVYYPKCFIAISSRDPRFNRDDVSDRLLVLRMERRKSFIPENELIAEVLGKRDALWTEIINDLNMIVKGLKENNQSTTVNFRMADFASFGMRVASIFGREKELQEIFDKMTLEQSEFTFEGDPLISTLTSWIETPDNLDRPITTGQLFEELKGIDVDSFSLSYKTTQGFGKRMRNVRNNLMQVLEVDISTRIVHGNKKEWIFTKHQSQRGILRGTNG